MWTATKWNAILSTVYARWRGGARWYLHFTNFLNARLATMAFESGGMFMNILWENDCELNVFVANSLYHIYANVEA